MTSFACGPMLYDMSNEEIIGALVEAGWTVEVKQRHWDAWRPASPEFHLGYGLEDCWQFRITKGDRQYEHAVDLYPIANIALNSKGVA